MASIYQRGKTYWVQFYHPVDGTLRRHSLRTSDPAHAKLAQQKTELLVQLALPHIRQFPLPDSLFAELGTGQVAPCSVTRPQPEPTLAPAPPMIQTTAKVDDRVPQALAVYVRYIRQENDSHHVLSKLSVLWKFFGDAAVNVLAPAKRENKPVQPPFYVGATLSGIRCFGECRDAQSGP
jgi:hypothetical protein